MRAGKTKKGNKLIAFGGAIAFVSCVDCFSGYVLRHLLSSKAKPLEFVKHFVEEVELAGHFVETLAADFGIYTPLKFQVYVPEVEQYLRAKKIQAERAEPENHPLIESNIRQVKALMKMAITYITRNTNFSVLGFTEDAINRLWGELINWATAIRNLKPSNRDHTKMRYELFHGKKPNMQDIRILPIFVDCSTEASI